MRLKFLDSLIALAYLKNSTVQYLKHQHRVDFPPSLTLLSLLGNIIWSLTENTRRQATSQTPLRQRRPRIRGRAPTPCFITRSHPSIAKDSNNKGPLSTLPFPWYCITISMYTARWIACMHAHRPQRWDDRSICQHYTLNLRHGRRHDSLHLSLVSIPLLLRRLNKNTTLYQIQQVGMSSTNDHTSGDRHLLPGIQGK